MELLITGPFGCAGLRKRLCIMSRADVDVLIAGGGFAGLTLASALRQSLGDSFAVVVADPSIGATHADDERASAIVASVRRLFETLGGLRHGAGYGQAS